MAINKELGYESLKKECNPEVFNFKSTKEVKELQGVIGQERSIKALEFGVNIDTDGYNIYVEGPNGIGKTAYCINYINKIAATKPTPDDWCYIYNFDNQNEPIALSLPAGEGIKFKKDMITFVEDIRKEINQTFNNEDYQKEKSLIEQELENKKNLLLQSLTSEAYEQGFEVKNSENGLYFLPIYEGKSLNEMEFSQLPQNIQEDFEKRSKIIEAKTLDIIKQLKELENNSKNKIANWINNIALLTISLQVNDLKNKYKSYKIITKYLDYIRKDILANMDKFLDNQPKQDNIPLQLKMNEMKPWEKYEVNLIVDNSKLKGAPVIADPNLTFFNLFGKLEYENIFGNLKTDYRMIKAGDVHTANGGFLILQATDLLSSTQIWDTFKKMIRTKQLYIDNIKDNNLNVAIVGLKPQAIPFKAKIVMLGTSQIFSQISMLDEDFRKMFRIKSEFEEVAPRNRYTIKSTVQFIASYCNKENLPHFSPAAVAQIIEYSSRLANDQTKLTTQLNELLQVISEAATWAKMDNKRTVSTEYVKKAIKEKLIRVSKYDYILQEMMMNDTIFIDTEGSKVGQINGLSVLTVGDVSFGKPSRITANTYMGKSGIINIEREVMLSGQTHSKGVMIISAYIGEKFAQEMPLSLSASVCFEQVYSGIDGDSASSTELYAILSSLSEVPINQAISVTGSINQKGEIQPIGGVTEKIEGYFNLCNQRGLTGEQGVMIPKQNIRNLNLNDEVIEAVKNNMFHIYAVNTADEGIEILTGIPAGKKDKSGNYTPGTINYLVYEKLKKYATQAMKEEK